MERRSPPWLIRRFDPAAVDPRGTAARAGRRIRIEDRFFPLATQQLIADGGLAVDLVRIRGHLGIHTDRAQDQNHSAFYPWHEGMIWNFVLWTAGSAAALLRRGRHQPRLVPLEPGLALWLDITETAHGITALMTAHPERHPEVVMLQVLGTPHFMRDVALRDAVDAVSSLPAPRRRTQPTPPEQKSLD